MDPLVSSAISGLVALLSLAIVALAASRLRWRRTAESRRHFLELCERAAHIGHSFGPAMLEQRHREWQERGLQIRQLQEQISMHRGHMRLLQHVLTAERDRAEAVTGQAKRWASLCREQRETIRELLALLENDPERVLNGTTNDTVNELRAIALALTYRRRPLERPDLPASSRLLLVAAAKIEATLCRQPFPEVAP